MNKLIVLVCVFALVFADLPLSGPDTWYSPMGIVPTLDGTNNNPKDTTLGAVDKPLFRNVPPAYADGKNSQRASASDVRNISLNLFSVQQTGNGGFNPNTYSDMLTFWGQFIDHDIDLSNTNASEPAPVPMPKGDPFFDPQGTGTVFMNFFRSTFVLDANGVRQQRNAITSFIDGSVIYAVDTVRSEALRTLQGGEMKVSSLAGTDGDMGPRNTFGFAMNNAAQKVGNADLYFFGDIRGNENPGVVMYHTLFVREHNRLARGFAAADKAKVLTDTQLFELARKWVRAEFQAISETQYFPLIVGPNVVPPYTGYKIDTDPSIMSPFSTACFRYGHSEGNEIFYRLDEKRNVIPQGNALMENVFFDNRWADFGIGVLARGMAIQAQQAVDIFVISPLRNFLYGQPGAGGTDLVVRNLQRGRDHGMGPLNEVRAAYGLPRYTKFEQITKVAAVVTALKGVYHDDINDIDLYAGLSEDVVDKSNLGPTFQAVIRDQYVRVRDGDRFWWNQPGIMFTDAELAEIKSLTLSKLVLLNTDVKAYPCNPFGATNINNCDRNGIIDPNKGAASSIVFAPVLVALLAIFAMLF